ncbi:hypothetical protein [Caldisalinibacter kiritimatiensis]|uniref:Uncharacterized protein n=1 Tax=Caldisalinibacter kiritimatiensis TaxID=1304284 RepID=R1CS02_9FIRM|nr:hypothetical protein [Caldisalinibacter kiritimatiensis]EOC99473.1 hypothetical protein L21TH_2478 [Caldisalinibacter kiritimatiensis]
MSTSNKVLEKVIQKKFSEHLEAKREGRDYNFKAELVKELKEATKDLEVDASKELPKLRKLIEQLKE